MKVGRIEQLTHTPGPWAVERRGYRWAITGPAPRRREGVEPSRWLVASTASDEPEDQPNVRLIAAAPTMYQELELAADTFRDFRNVLFAIGKDTMAAAADVAERHIREYLATIHQTDTP
jgi:hypothetical protein